MSKVYVGFCLIVACVMATQASLVEYTFEGYVNHCEWPFNYNDDPDDDFNIIDTYVKYIVGVDVEKVGYTLEYGHITEESGFYSEYIDGYILEDGFTRPTYYNYYISDNSLTEIKLGQLGHILEIYANNGIETWRIGQSFTAYEASMATTSYGYEIWSNVILTSINGATVPEPNIISLLCTGILSIVFFGRLRRNK